MAFNPGFKVPLTLASLGRKTARLARKLALLVEITVLSPPLC
jgi:hypothetical protein